MGPARVYAFLVWRGVLISVNGGNLDVDNPLFLGLSSEDVGSGVMAFAFSAAAFGMLTDRVGTGGARHEGRRSGRRDGDADRSVRLMRTVRHATLHPWRLACGLLAGVIAVSSCSPARMTALTSSERFAVTA